MGRGDGGTNSLSTPSQEMNVFDDSTRTPAIAPSMCSRWVKTTGSIQAVSSIVRGRRGSNSISTGPMKRWTRLSRIGAGGNAVIGRD